jgi:hypothetical protein
VRSAPAKWVVAVTGELDAHGAAGLFSTIMKASTVSLSVKLLQMVAKVTAR